MYDGLPRCELHAVITSDALAVQELISQASGEATLASLRVLIVHDWIVAWGGAERTIEEMLAVFPQADVVVGLVGEGRRNVNAVTRQVKETWLARLPFARRHHRWFLPLYPAAFRSVDTRGYDLIISSSSAFSKSIVPPRGVPHLCYCHTPPRYLWDLTEEYNRDASVQGMMLSLAGPVLRSIDRASSRGVTKFLANSEFVAERIERAYGRTAAVVYPPVSPKPASRQAIRSDALLSLGRLVPYKRVDLAIQAANMLGARLIVAGEGPERQALERLAGPTIEFLGAVSERVAGELMESCRAMLFCAEEDFGIAPVEANAHGLPVVAYNRGAARESMRDGTTAVFFDDATPESLMEAIGRSTMIDWKDADLRANAIRFEAQRFREELVREVLSVL